MNNIDTTTGTSLMRTFSETGATRSADDGKIHYKGFLSPFALRAFGQYMEKHRIQADGKLREPDNWKLGIPLASYEDSMYRHMQEFRFVQEGGRITERDPVDGEDRTVSAMDIMCALFFNVQGWLHEKAKATLPESEYPKANAVDAILAGPQPEPKVPEDFSKLIFGGSSPFREPDKAALNRPRPMIRETEDEIKDLLGDSGVEDFGSGGGEKVTESKWYPWQPGQRHPKDSQIEVELRSGLMITAPAYQFDWGPDMGAGTIAKWRFV